MAQVNLWELITTVAGREGLPNQEECVAIQDACMTSRIDYNEFSLEIGPDFWLVKFFSIHHDGFVQIQIDHDGCVTISRDSRLADGINESRTIRMK